MLSVAATLTSLHGLVRWVAIASASWMLALAIVALVRRRGQSPLDRRSLAAMTGMIESLTFRTDRMRALAESGFATATDLADWLVREANVPFREAHHITGQAVKLAEAKGCGLADLALAELQAIDARIEDGVFSVLSVDASVKSRTSHGGTAPSGVRARIAEARMTLEQNT